MQIRVGNGTLYVGDPGLDRDAAGALRLFVKNGRWNVYAITQFCRRVQHAGVVALVAMHEDVSLREYDALTLRKHVETVVVETGKMAVAGGRPLVAGQYHETGWHGFACRALEHDNLLSGLVVDGFCRGVVCYTRDGDGIYPVTMRVRDNETVVVVVNFDFQTDEGESNDE